MLPTAAAATAARAGAPLAVDSITASMKSFSQINFRRPPSAAGRREGRR